MPRAPVVDTDTEEFPTEVCVTAGRCQLSCQMDTGKLEVEDSQAQRTFSPNNFISHVVKPIP